MAKQPLGEVTDQIRNMQHKDKAKIDFNLLEKKRQSDFLIISNGNDKFVGVLYIRDLVNKKNIFFLEFKCYSQLSYYYLRIAQQIGIPCIESISLARLMYDELHIGAQIATNYYEIKTGVGFPRYKEQKELSNFQQRIKKD